MPCWKCVNAVIFWRTAWSAILIVSVFLCGTFIKKAYKQWNDTPVIVTFATEQTLISEIPFPAVTICPLVKANRTIFNYTDIILKTANLQDITIEEWVAKISVFGTDLLLFSLSVRQKTTFWIHLFSMQLSASVFHNTIQKSHPQWQPSGLLVWGNSS